MTKKNKILIATGGTGGHVFPAYSLVNFLVKKNYDVELTTDIRGFYYLKYYKNLNLHISQISEWIKNNRIDRIFHSLISAQNEINFIKTYLLGVSSLKPDAFDSALDNIESQKDKILNFFENWFKEHRFLGDAKAVEDPDVAIILGATKPILDIRLTESIKLLKHHPDTLIILSGGGFLSLKSEA